MRRSLAGFKGKWKVRVVMTVAFLIPLWLIPCWLRQMLPGNGGWLFGLALSDLLGGAMVGFLTNNYRFGVLLYVACTAVELLLHFLSGSVVVALWVGDLLPAAVAIYFAQQLFINMGD